VPARRAATGPALGAAAGLGKRKELDGRVVVAVEVPGGGRHGQVEHQDARAVPARRDAIAVGSGHGQLCTGGAPERHEQEGEAQGDAERERQRCHGAFAVESGDGEYPGGDCRARATQGARMIKLGVVEGGRQRRDRCAIRELRGRYHPTISIYHPQYQFACPGALLAITERACPSCHAALPAEAQFCMHCGAGTPTDPGVPPRIATTGAIEVAQVTKALAGRYRIEGVLGEGGMATVYLAEDQKHQRKVAVKVMRPELAATLGADRFLREVQIAAKLQHPHVLPLFDSGESGGVLYYVMPLVEGESLKDRLAREGALPPDDALRLAREIAEALSYAHKRGIIHRDIKPANILLSEGHALVADFGIARAVEDGSGQALTKTGLAVGTPQYMAPEQATGERDVDGRADVYATGAILYEMLAGEPPFTGSNARAILTKSLTERPKPITQVRAGLVPILDTVVQKALAKSPDDRYATAADFVAALDASRSQSSGALPAITPPQATQVVPAVGSRRSTVLRVVGIGAIALVAAGGAWFALRGRRPGPLPHAGPARVVVLPFTAQGAGVEDYLVQGIADEVRGKLTGMRGLQLIAPASAQAYKGSTKSPQEIGRELGADYLLGGIVQISGAGADRTLKVTTRMIDAQVGNTRWQHDFEGRMLDVFKLQADVAEGTAAALGLPPVSSEQTALARRATGNVDAYMLFLKARSLTSRDPATLREAVGNLEQAISLDDKFAEAWALLSVTSSFLYSNGSRDPQVAARSREAYERAMTLEPSGHRGLVAKARYQSSIDADPAGARETLDRRSASRRTTPRR
jgi:serine/threonine-protein kinase